MRHAARREPVSVPAPPLPVGASTTTARQRPPAFRTLTLLACASTDRPRGRRRGGCRCTKLPTAAAGRAASAPLQAVRREAGARGAALHSAAVAMAAWEVGVWEGGVLAVLRRARSGALQPGGDVSTADKPHVSRLRPAQPAWGQGSTPVRMGVRISQRRGPKPQPSLLRGATPAIMHDSARAAARGQRPWPRPGAFPAGAAAARRAPCPLAAPQCNPTCLACCENR